MKTNETPETAQIAAVAAIARASSTPFWTAFKVTMGIALAQITIMLGGLLLLALVLYTAFHFLFGV